MDKTVKDNGDKIICLDMEVPFIPCLCYSCGLLMNVQEDIQVDITSTFLFPKASEQSLEELGESIHSANRSDN